VEGDLRRLTFAWVRLYCVLVPKPYRRTWIRHTLDFGPLGPLLWVSWAPFWPLAERLMRVRLPR
jgi:hypothetical protein